MPDVSALTASYSGFLIGPRRGDGVCALCFNLTDGYDRCWACAHGGDCVDAVAPISYSVAGERLHHALVRYKRRLDRDAQRLGAELAAVLWRYLRAHERCLARDVGVEGFDLVTTVPSSDRERDGVHPLHRLVGEVIEPTRGRHARLLRRSGRHVHTHEFSATRFETDGLLSGEAILLIDDTWTTGANAQSAAATLKLAGAGPVAVVVIGRHLNREWHQNDARLRSFPRPFDWNRCDRCAAPEIRD
jgi:predicted amidophosphoribosyltransferase